MKFEYDVIVIGAGHAGCEAACAAANMGSSTLLITMDMNKIAQMSCNPAVGGIAKGQIVREIDALGGQMGIVTDRSSIQFRMLNRSKGPAMWSPRAQADRQQFINNWRRIIENTPNLYVWQDTVVSLDVEQGRACGVKTAFGVDFKAKAVVLTAGTFLNGKMHVGRVQLSGGRVSEPSSHGVQDGDHDFHHFSYLPSVHSELKQRPCYIVFTNEKVHQILRDDIAESPLFNGQIQSKGPRYCPSIETKLVTFPDKTSHQLFVEPEGETTHEMYLNGFSSSMPLHTQINAIQQIPGFENVHVFRPGYAIEYDYFDPTQLTHSLETKLVQNLFFAGQVNGTTGYEEAAGQGLIAGINAHLKVAGKEPFVLGRDEAYIGVLIDDLVTKGVDEPYRMFTSRAEHRILLRQDDADIRLTGRSYAIGLASRERYQLMVSKKQQIEQLIDFAKEFTVKANVVNEKFAEMGVGQLSRGYKLYDLLLRPELSFPQLVEIIPQLKELVATFDSDRIDEILEAAEIRIKYKGYIEREEMVADRIGRLDKVKIKGKFDYSKVTQITIEARQKLQAIAPETIGQASRIPGISPNDINILLLLLGR